MGIETDRVYVEYSSSGGAAVGIVAAYDLPNDHPSGCDYVEYVVGKSDLLVTYAPGFRVLDGQALKRYLGCGDPYVKSGGYVGFDATVRAEDIMQGTIDDLDFQATVLDAAELPY
jgi:hypothetical protein